VEEIRKKEDLWGLEFEEILGFRSKILRFEGGLRGFEVEIKGLRGGLKDLREDFRSYH